MIYEPSWVALSVFLAFVGLTLGLSFYLGGKAKSSQGYFAAHGQIPWFINGVAFAGDYLSAASFLGICGMIAFYGYDGFLYSIGYLAGWVVALFVVAEPIKRLGKFTFADALNSRFQSKGIRVAAGISTLLVSLFYLIPQMVGAGVLVQPLLGFPHWAGVVLVGTTVIIIVVTAGMVSTTWVQFLKGGLLVIFSTILTVVILLRGFEVKQGGMDGYEFRTIGPVALEGEGADVSRMTLRLDETVGEWETLNAKEGTWGKGGPDVVRIKAPGDDRWTVFVTEIQGRNALLREAQTVTETKDKKILVNGQPKGTKKGEPELHPVGYVSKLPDERMRSTGSLDPVEFFRTLQNSTVVLWKKGKPIKMADGSTLTIYSPKPTAGKKILRPGEHPQFAGIRSENLIDKLNFLSLMLALFCGTASLPHILIRYYTVKDESSARKSTIVGIASIGLFYVLTLYMGLGAMTSGALDPTNSNMAAPLLARSVNEWLFAVISAIAFTTVLGTVSGLILATAGAVVHDLLGSFLKTELNDHSKVRLAKMASGVVGAIAIVLGILFEKFNVTYLVGWAFSVAASANLPTLVMLLFWKKTTREGVIAAIVVGMLSSLAWIFLSGETLEQVFGLTGRAYVPFSQPGIVTIPLGFLTLVVVSLLTQPRASLEEVH